MALILASASPRRFELLKLITEDFLVVTSRADESLSPGILPQQAVILLAQRKAEAVAEYRPDDVVIGADTVVALDDQIFGKPCDRKEAAEMLSTLSGKTHEVYTGVCIWHKGVADCFSQVAKVTFAKMDKQEIADYVASEEPDDKAGAYGIQGLGARFIARLEGDYYTVMGLPVQALYQALRQKGLLTSL
ncbi:Maf family protein [Oscillospiraceae bacterium LTW-04]|nr:Maf family protein [Oscillospiraceae bacterium MB24-C1]